MPRRPRREDIGSSAQDVSCKSSLPLCAPSSLLCVCPHGRKCDSNIFEVAPACISTGWRKNLFSFSFPTPEVSAKAPFDLFAKFPT